MWRKSARVPSVCSHGSRPRCRTASGRCGISASHRSPITRRKCDGPSRARSSTSRYCRRTTARRCGISASHRSPITRRKRHGRGRLATAASDGDSYAPTDKQGHDDRNRHQESPWIHQRLHDCGCLRVVEVNIERTAIAWVFVVNDWFPNTRCQARTALSFAPRLVDKEVVH